MPPMNEHTPTPESLKVSPLPWKLSFISTAIAHGSSVSITVASITNMEETVCLVHEMAYGNAAFVVEACNNYARYKSALEKIAKLGEPETLDRHERALGWNDRMLAVQIATEALHG